MSVEDEQAGPLHRHVPAVLGVPVLRPGAASKAKGPSKEDLAPLRVLGEWRPAEILKRFGPAASDEQYLSRLLVAAAVLQGGIRLRDMAERLAGVLKGVDPRIRRLADEPSLLPKKDALKKLEADVELARRGVQEVRARALNETSERPGALRLLDLHQLAAHTGVAILALEISNKQNLSGLEFARAAAARRPDQRHAEAWIVRAHGSALPRELLLFTPPEYRRVVVVHADGRLAYDPLSG